MSSEELNQAGGTSHDIQTLFSSSDRDFLVRYTGDQVKIESLKGKKVGIYFSASWCGPCQRFTPKLVEVYNELSSKGDFEIVFVSADKDDQSFNGYFSKMPWLAVPFSDSTTRSRLDDLFKVKGIPYLVILDEYGNILTNGGVEIIGEHGAEGYPFTPQRMQEIKEQEEEARRNQSVKSLLVSSSRDFVVSSDGKKVPVTELEGKTIGLYFSLFSFKLSADFTEKLVEFYRKLKEHGEKFEIVMVPLDTDEEEESVKKGFENMPWLALPLKDKICEKLVRYFELSTLPTLVIIGPDGKTLHSNVADIIEEHGSNAYPFTLEHFSELEMIEKAKREAQTLESILVNGDLNFVVAKDGVKVPVSDLVGKHVLLYFSAHWCPPCRAFTPKLIEAYNTIKAKDDAFEVIFISSDRDEASFEEYFSTMPWLALPFGDKRKGSLARVFKVRCIPTLVALGPTGQTVTTNAQELILLHGDKAYPFTEDRVKEIEAECEELAKGWPKKMKHELHADHELELIRANNYICDGCAEPGGVWSFKCAECDFDLHPKCALGEDKDLKADVQEDGNPKEGWVCDGDVCHKA